MKKQYAKELLEVTCCLSKMSNAEIDKFYKEFNKEYGDPSGIAKKICEALKSYKIKAHI